MSDDTPDIVIVDRPIDHRDTFRALLLLRPAAARQIPFLLG